MHRTNRVLTWVAGGLLGVSLATGTAAAIQPDAPAPAQRGKANAVVVTINGSKRLSMTPKRPIRSVINEKENVARVQVIPDDNESVLVFGLQTGTTRITMTDSMGIKEEIDLIVEFDIDAVKAVLRRAVPTAAVEPIPAGINTIVLTGTVAHAEDIELILRVAQGVLVSGVPAVAAAQGQSIIPITIVNAMTVGGLRQVQLDVTIASVNRTELRQLGVNFAVVGSTVDFGSLIGSLATSVNNDTRRIFLSTLIPQPTTNVTFGIVPANFGGFIQALHQERLATLLASPKLVTKSGKPATFLSGGYQAVPEVTASGVGGGTVGARFEPFGTLLTFLPIVLGNGKIYLEVDTANTTLNASNGFAIAGVVVQGRDAQMVRTAVEMEPGQTFAVGGMIQVQKGAVINKTPLLGDLPFLGTAFSTTSFNEAETELLFTVTPYLVDAMDCRQAPCQVPGQETRSPDDFELFLELILEAPRGQREIFPNKRYKPAWKNDSTANQFPCGGGIGSGCGANGSGCANGNCGAQTGQAVTPIPTAPTAEAPATLPSEPTTLPPMTTVYPPGAARASRQ
jgi:pilus assembly protein CpaC